MSVKLGSSRIIDGKKATVVEFCSEPNTGLCVVEYNNWSFTMPSAFAEQMLAIQDGALLLKVVKDKIERISLNFQSDDTVLSLLSEILEAAEKAFEKRPYDTVFPEEVERAIEKLPREVTKEVGSYNLVDAVLYWRKLWDELKKMELEHGQAQIDLMAADKMAQCADHLVMNHLIDARSALADSRLEYGEPYTYEHSNLEKPQSICFGLAHQEVLVRRENAWLREVLDVALDVVDDYAPEEDPTPAISLLRERAERMRYLFEQPEGKSKDEVMTALNSWATKWSKGTGFGFLTCGRCGNTAVEGDIPRGKEAECPTCGYTGCK